jgi:hypothetical protein
MKGRFRRACIRCASRIGSKSRVKFADEKRASFDNGGRPCLHPELVSIDKNNSSYTLYEVCQTQLMQRLTCEPCQVIVGDGC